MGEELLNAKDTRMKTRRQRSLAALMDTSVDIFLEVR